VTSSELNTVARTSPGRRAADLRRMFAPPDRYQVDKRCHLEDALRTHVRPGMTLHFGYNQARPMALSNALVRVFANTAPQFTIVAAGLVSNQAAMFSTGLIKKLVVSFIGENYPAPSPNRVMQDAINSGTVEIENQSLLVIAQRLAAGAYGFPFALTRSLRGSSLANADSFKVIDDPFGTGEQIGAVKAIVPDITFIHALAADPQGNLLIAPPLGEGEIAAFAASSGVIATVERIVSPDVIRQYSHLAKVPSNRVLSVSEVPMGCHPYGIYGPPGLGVGYVEDYDFFRSLQKATKSPATFTAWVDEWIHGVESHEEYVGKLGVARVRALQGGAADRAWETDVTEAEIAAAEIDEEDAVDRMVVAAARMIEARTKAKGYGVIGSGVGFANLAAWLAVSRMQQQDGLPVELIAEIGLYGFFPKPGEPFIFSNRNIPTCKSLTTAETVLGLHVSGRHNQCLAIIGAAQIDQLGNVNSTYGSDGRFLVGSGGANDIASAAAELLVVAQQSAKRLVPELPYITSIGERVSTLVTDLGIYQKRNGRLVLTAYFASESDELEMVLDNIRRNCGWELEIAEDLIRAPCPLAEDLFRIRLYDPRREFLTSALQATI
jgi:acyl CoA:acetate/3-ketoacid CoA transferase alpha subunit/acyl CoA:acetate/3-ketoacid CoA transferase beta subunit